MCPVLEADLYFEVILLSYKNSCNTYLANALPVLEERTKSLMSPGHVGLEGEEKADKLARKAASTPAIVGSEP